LAVEKAMKMSPDVFSPRPPTPPTPSETRRARRLSWCGSSGASVPTTTMMEPPPSRRTSTRHARRRRHSTLAGVRPRRGNSPVGDAATR
jgi:hypothetical protein